MSSEHGLINNNKIKEYIIKHYTENSVINNGITARIKNDKFLKNIIKNKLIDMFKECQINFGKDVIQNWDRINKSIQENNNNITNAPNLIQYKKSLNNIINEYKFIQKRKFLSEVAEIFIIQYSICIAEEYLKNFINIYKNKKVKPSESYYIKDIEGESSVIKFKKCDNIIDTDREIILEKNIKSHTNSIVDNVVTFFGFGKNSVYIEN